MLAVDIALSVTESVDPVAPGTDLTYVLNAINLGDDLAGSVSVFQELDLPVGVHVSSIMAAPAQGTFAPTDPTDATRGRWLIGDLIPGVTVSLTTVLTVDSLADTSGQILFAASAADGFPGNNFATETTDLEPPRYDYGDAPDTGPGTGPGNYRTSQADDGPSHVVASGLHLGPQVSIEPAAVPNVAASSDNDDGLRDPASDLRVTAGEQSFFRVWAVNDTGRTAYLNWWVDLNRDGVFDDSESNRTNVEPLPGGKSMTLPLPPVPPSSHGTTYLRLRLTTDATVTGSTGPASDGEVEDYLLRVTLPTNLVVSNRVAWELGDPGAGFGRSVVSIGDLDGNGFDELAFGVPAHDGGGEERGGVIFVSNEFGLPVMRPTVDGTPGRFPATLDDHDQFGWSLAALGDLDADGVPDLLIGAPQDDDGIVDTGAVYVTFMNADATVKRAQKISATAGGFDGVLPGVGRFGASVASLGDLDRDGVVDVAVGAPNDPAGGSERGAVWILFLNRDGTVKHEQKITHNVGGLGGVLKDGDVFGRSVASLGDLNFDGTTDLLVGAPLTDDGGENRGAVWVLLLNSDGTVLSANKISSTTFAPISPVNYDADAFGTSVALLPGVTENGIRKIAIGARNAIESDRRQGAVWILWVNPTGLPLAAGRITDTAGDFDPWLEGSDQFGSSVAWIGDFNGNGIGTLAVGAVGTESMWMLDFSAVMDLGDAPDVAPGRSPGDYQTRLTDDGPVHLFAGTVKLGTRVDAELDGQPGVAAQGDDRNGGDEDGLIDPVSDLRLTEGTNPQIRLLVTPSSSSVSHLYGWIDYNRDGHFDDSTERAYVEIPARASSILTPASLTFPQVPRTTVGKTYARFRISTDPAAQHATGWARNGEVEDYAVEIAAPSDGTLLSFTKIAHETGGFGALNDSDDFGGELESLGDLDGDGVNDVAVGAPYDDTGGPSRGAVYVLLLNADGTVKTTQKIAHLTGGFGTLKDGDWFGKI